jgi:hypothetical protein
MKNYAKHRNAVHQKSQNFGLLVSHLFFGFLVCLSLLTGCGSGAQYAKSDTPEGEAFLKKTEEAWAEVQALIDPKNPQSTAGRHDPEAVHRKITMAMQESSGTFRTLVKARKISKSQCDRYLSMVKQFAKN